MFDVLKTGRKDIDRPFLMGILNITPDSFSDGGSFLHTSSATEHALGMVEDGADIIDIGGESTRPGAKKVSLDEELKRVIPVIESIRKHTQTPISIDTSKPHVMQAAIEAGANMINDVFALRHAGALEMAAKLQVPVCLMHMQANPETMQDQPQYRNVVDEVELFLQERVAACEETGIPRSQIMVDPGIGFGKTLEHNLKLIASSDRLARLATLLMGMSRKSLFSKMFDLEVNERMVPSVVAALWSAINHAGVLRVHDVKETQQALALWQQLENYKSNL